MTNTRRTWGLISAAALVLLLAAPSSVLAACASGQITLGNTNTTLSTVYVCVTVQTGVVGAGETDGLADDSIITVNGVFDGTTDITSQTSIQQIAFTGVSITQKDDSAFDLASHGDWAGGPDGCSGFDGFNSITWTGCLNGQDSPNSSGLSWQVDGTVDSNIVVHLKVPACTGFWSNTTTSSPGSENCGTNPLVPEPGTLTLLGTGLIGIAGAIRRRLRKS